MKQIKNFTIGADPEFFLLNTGTNMFVPASMFIEEETKDKPIDLGDGFKVLRDNVMTEFNIPPANNKEEFINNLIVGLDRIRKAVIPNREIDFKMVPSALFSNEDLKLYPGGMEFGCAPAENAYDIIGRSPQKTGLRFAGGHVHVGNEVLLEDVEAAVEFVKILDMTLGVPALELDKDDKRREFYGQPGNFRFTSYGIEYRTLSNFWLKDTEGMAWAYDGVKKAVDMFNKGVRFTNEQVLKEFKLEETYA